MAEGYVETEGNKGLSQVATCMEHLAKNQLPCISFIWELKRR